MTNRDLRLACLHAAELPAYDLPAIVKLTYLLLIVALVFRSLSLPCLLLASITYLATRTDLRLREHLHRHAQSFAERLADALLPAAPTPPLQPAAPPNPTHLILNACRRAAATEVLRLNRGIASLATISSTAAFFGLLATCLGIIHSFRGTSGDSTSIMAALINLISEAIVPTALSLAIAILAYTAHHVLNARSEALALQMDTLSLSLANALRRES